MSNKDFVETNKTLFDSHQLVDKNSGDKVIYITGIETENGLGMEIRKTDMPACDLTRSEAEAELIAEINASCDSFDAGNDITILRESNQIAEQTRRGPGKLTTDQYLVYVGDNIPDQGVHIVHDPDSDQYALVFHDGWEKYYRKPA